MAGFAIADEAGEEAGRTIDLAATDWGEVIAGDAPLLAAVLLCPPPEGGGFKLDLDDTDAYVGLTLPPA